MKPTAEEGPAAFFWLRPVGPFLFCSLIFGVAYTQAPLYYSNQNQYFLHGLARAGIGILNEDWLANTLDPAPIFSAVVAFTHTFLHDWLFHAYHLAYLGLYALVLWQLFAILTGENRAGCAGLFFFTLVSLVHSGAARLLSVHFLGKDYPWYFQTGLANQYILGPGLQPSVAGVFLLASLVAFANKKPWLAIGSACLAATLHSTYLLGAASLTFAYMLLHWREHGLRQAVGLGFAALGLVLPVAVYSALTFSPSSAEEFAHAQHILAHFRIPHHAVVERWLDGIAWAQVGWIAVACILVRSTRLGQTMMIVAILGVVLTSLQLWTDSDTLALLFPWRISAILVPASTAIVCAKAIQPLVPILQCSSTERTWCIRLSCGAVLAALVVVGLAIQWFGLAYRMNEAELPFLEYVRTHKRAGDVYLIPVSAPRPGRPGVASASFLPPKITTASEYIAVDLQRFRLYTGAPIFVDFKAIPYKDTEVIEWRRRFELCQEWYKTQKWDALERYGITHVVSAADKPLHDPLLEPITADSQYRLYRVRPASPRQP